MINSYFLFIYKVLICYNFTSMKCIGCGVELQYDDPNNLGYTPKKDSCYCQRCFRLTHYDDVMFSLRFGIEPAKVLDKIVHTEGIIAWVVDVFDLENAFIDNFNEVFANRNIIIIFTKTDLLSNIISSEKLQQFLYNRLKQLNINYNGILASGLYGKENSIYIKQQLADYANGEDIIVAGKANAGKSTLLNQLLNSDTLTTSRYPGTTIDFNTLHIDDLTIIDTPGIETKHSVVMEVAEKYLKQVLPLKPIDAKVYQFYSDQCYCIGGLVRIDIVGAKKGSIVFYVSDRIKIHRTSLSNANNIWNKRNKILTPYLDGKEKSLTYPCFKDKKDVVINGLGFFSITGDYDHIKITVNNDIYINIREAMI